MNGPAPRRAAALFAASLLVSCGSPRPVAEGSQACDRCHGAGGSAAPPPAVGGGTDTTAVGVGAHRAHLEAGTLAAPLGCEDCHVVPAAGTAHVGDGAVVTFGALARTGSPPGAAPAWDRAAARCSNVYCHGATLAGGSNVAPRWTSVGVGEAACGTCHGNPPPSHAAFGAAGGDCHTCHGHTVLAGGGIDLASGRHLDGTLDFSGDGGQGLSCTTCHAAPPATGAHLAHAGGVPADELEYGDLRAAGDYAAPGAGYAFGCGQCHPTDPASHFGDAGADGLPDVVLAPPASGGGALKGRNASGAAFDAGTGTCAGVTCHSSGQEAPVFVATPAWTAAPGALGCDGCHGNPPRYPSGGAGTAEANSHLQLQAGGREWGHFAGFGGPWHSSKHGVVPGITDSAPITCQACHHTSVDAAATAPGGFYWLNTSGAYQLPGGDADRLAGVGYARLACATCHAEGGAAPPGAGRADPAAHVNGVRDVVFDPRTALPELAWLPAGANRPVRPYWVTTSLTPPAGDAYARTGTTVSFHLAGAAYDPATKTCSSVACHLSEAGETWGRPHEGFDACTGCHTF